jgi:hypothetical protein
MHKALIDFPCSFNGIDIMQVKAGSVMDFGDLANGLVESGIIEPAKEKTSAKRQEPEAPTE